jgi:UDP-N-acetylglucosamine transferase subunit ALG13
MIFATVGTQLPFDRLLAATDAWAAARPEETVIAQTGASTRVFAHLTCRPHLEQADFADCMHKAKVIVAHAGMGTILSAAEAGKPLILLPRRADLGEHRNDHQLATAAEMAVLSNVTVIDSADELADALDRALSRADVCQPRLSASASPRLLDALTDFIWASESTPARKTSGLFGWVRA